MLSFPQFPRSALRSPAGAQFRQASPFGRLSWQPLRLGSDSDQYLLEGHDKIDIGVLCSERRMQAGAGRVGAQPHRDAELAIFAAIGSRKILWICGGGN